MIHENYMKSALGYVELAERANGPIPHPADFSYVWGDALAELERADVDARVINLETAVTSGGAWAPKGINYRMNPKNVPCLAAAKIDICALANNHILDWGDAGLSETIESLKRAGIRTAGAGRDIEEAGRPAILEVPGKGRLIVFSFGSESSGIPPDWAASRDRPGVDLLEEPTSATLGGIRARVARVRRGNDVVVASIHWGSNWGYGIPGRQRKLAHALIDDAGVDLVHGHSSHHAKAIEVYRGKLILYGCGDFLNDYEGIEGYEEFRADLALMYFPVIESATGNLVTLAMSPMRIRNFRLNRADPADTSWIAKVLSREGGGFRTRLFLGPNGLLELEWPEK